MSKLTNEERKLWADGFFSEPHDLPGEELFKMVYQWGRVGVVVDHNAPAFQSELRALLETLPTPSSVGVDTEPLSKDPLEARHG
jgi:hypothetical protein